MRRRYSETPTHRTFAGCQRTPEIPWENVGKEVEAIVTEHLISGQALTPLEVHDQMMMIGRTTRQKVQYLIDTEINPGVAEHGGAVQIMDVNEGTLYLRLHGGCQGCGAAEFTLRQGIETIIKRAVPEIQHIIDITNHRAGTSPYYRRPDRNHS